MAIARIHVNQHVVKRNKKTGEREPCITIKHRGQNTYVHNVDIDGPSRMVYSPDKPLSCGATLWIECDDEDLTEFTLPQEFDPEGEEDCDCHEDT